MNTMLDATIVAARTKRACSGAQRVASAFAVAPVEREDGGGVSRTPRGRGRA
jgi:hypothetical protein